MAKGKKTGGRKKGTPNNFTASARDAFRATFDNLGGVDTLTRWAEENLTEFYKIYARLIPVDLHYPDQKKDITQLFISSDLEALKRYAQMQLIENDPTVKVLPKN